MRVKIPKNVSLLAVGTLAVALGVTAGYVYLSQPRSKLANSNQPGSVIDKTPDHPGAGAAGTNPTPDPSPQATPPPQTDPKYNSTTLAKPTGQLLSNHTISLSGTADNNRPVENSTCNTVPGATCTIRLTGPGGMIKYATDSPVGVDANGAMSIQWNAKDRGLISGPWKAEAVASKSNQTAVSYPDTLTVNP